MSDPVKRDLKKISEVLDREIDRLSEEWKRNPEKDGPHIQDLELQKAVYNEIQAQVRLVKLDYLNRLKEVVELLEDHPR